MMDRGQQHHQFPQHQGHQPPPHHDQRNLEHQQHQQQLQQPYDPQPSPVPQLGQLTRSMSYTSSMQTFNQSLHDTPAPSSSSSSLQQQGKQEYVGLGISIQRPEGTASTTQSLLSPSSESSFGTPHLLTPSSRYPQPPTPSFPPHRGSSPASSVWSASDQGTSSSNSSSGFIPSLHRYPPFFNKVDACRMVSDEKFSNLISWSHSGTSFYITNIKQFEMTVLPLYFKHSHFSSFVRQLNMYGFHKVNKSPRRKVSPESEIWEFRHTKFIKHRPDLLSDIERRGGDVDYIREGDLTNHVSAMQIQQKDTMKKLNATQEQVVSLAKELHETRERQGALEEMVNGLLEVLKRQQQISPTTVQRPSSSQTSQTSVPQVMQRRTSMQHATPNRRLERQNSMYSLSSSQEIEPFMPTETSATPMRSSPPPSQPSSSEGSSQKSPASANFFQTSAVFSTPSAPSNQYTPVTPVSQPSSQPTGPQPSPRLHRSKSAVMSSLPSPNVTPSPVYTYNSPAQYSRSFSQTMQTPKQQSQQQEMHTLYRHPSTYSLQQQHQQPAEPPATYQSAVAPMPATPTRPSSQTYSTQTPIFQHTPFRQSFGGQQQDPHTQQQLNSPASFQNIGGIFAQKQRRTNNQDDNEDMDLGA